MMETSPAEGSTRVVMVPRFSRVARNTSTVILVIALFSYVIPPHSKDFYDDVLLPFGILTVLVPLSVWFWVVPIKLEYDNGELEIKFRFRAGRRVAWRDLYKWGVFENGIDLLNLEFNYIPTMQVFCRAYAPADWLKLRQFLILNQADREASIWIGLSGFGSKNK